MNWLIKLPTHIELFYWLNFLYHFFHKNFSDQSWKLLQQYKEILHDNIKFDLLIKCSLLPPGYRNLMRRCQHYWKLEVPRCFANVFDTTAPCVVLFFSCGLMMMAQRKTAVVKYDYIFVYATSLCSTLNKVLIPQVVCWFFRP